MRYVVIALSLVTALIATPTNAAQQKKKPTAAAQQKKKPTAPSKKTLSFPYRGRWSDGRQIRLDVRKDGSVSFEPSSPSQGYKITKVTGSRDKLVVELLWEFKEAKGEELAKGVKTLTFIPHEDGAKLEFIFTERQEFNGRPSRTGWFTNYPDKGTLNREFKD